MSVQTGEHGETHRRRSHDDGRVESSESDRRRPRSPVAVIIAVVSVAAVLAATLSDWPLATLSEFWSQHAMLTNLVSSAVFAGFTIAVIERWLRGQEERQEELRRRAEQRRLTVVRSAAYNAVARGPIALQLKHNDISITIDRDEVNILSVVSRHLPTDYQPIWGCDRDITLEHFFQTILGSKYDCLEWRSVASCKAPHSDLNRHLGSP